MGPNRCIFGSILHTFRMRNPDFVSKFFNEKHKFRYVKMNSRIGAWENEKKMQAKHKMERREVLPQPLVFTCKV
jgi:hypothetical protein